MKVVWWPFALVIYTNWMIQARFVARMLWPFILIRPEHRGNKGLLAHELQHVHQMIRYGVLPFLLLYLLSDRFPNTYSAITNLIRAQT